MNYLKETTITNLTSCLIVGGGGLSKVLSQKLLDQNCVVFLVDEGIDSAAIIGLKQIYKQRLFVFSIEDLLSQNIDFVNGLDYLFYLPTYFEKGIKIAQLLLDIAQHYQAKFLLSSYEDFELRLLTHYRVFNDFLKRSFINPIKLIEILRLIESLVSERSHQGVVDVRIVRSAFVYGPDLTSLESPLFYNLFYALIQNNLKITLPNDGMIEVYPTYVDDLVLGLVKAMFSQNSTGKMFGLVSENKHTLLQFAYLLRQSVELPVQIQFISDVEGKFDFLIPSGVLDSQKSLGWFAREDFSNGLKKTLKPILPWLRQKAAQISDHTNSNSQTNTSFETLAYSTTISPLTNSSKKTNKLNNNLKPQNIDYFQLNQKYQKAAPPEPIKVGKEEGVPLLSDYLAAREQRKQIKSLDFKQTVVRQTQHGIAAPVVNTSIFQELWRLISLKKQKNKKDFKSRNRFIFGIVVVTILIGVFLLPNIITSVANRQLRSSFDKSKDFLTDDNTAKSDKYIKDLNSIYKVLEFGQKYLTWQENVFNFPVSKKFKAELKTDRVFIGVVKNLQQATMSSSELYHIVVGTQTGEPQDYLTDIHSRLVKVHEDIGFWQADNDIDDEDEIAKKLLTIKDLSWRGTQIVTLLAGVLNTTEKKTLLIMIQDGQEMRPGGGFLEGIGLLFMDKGKLLDYQSFDTYKLDSKLKGLIKPPEIIAKNLAEDHWWLRDSNIYPDFTKSAGAALWFVEKELEKKSDGAIGIDEKFLAEILSKIGPIFLPEFNEQVTAKNLAERLQSHAEVNFFAGDKYQKPFLISVTDQIFTKLENLSVKDLVMITSSIYDSLNSRNLQIWLPGTEVEDFVANNGWDGRLRKTPDQLLKFGKVNTPDYFSFYEANLGTNKVNYVINRHVKQQLSFNDSGSLHKKITIDWQNNSQGDVWPLGNYKNLVQFLIPPTARDLRVVRIVDGKKTFIKTDKLSLSVESEKQLFQALIEIPSQKQGQLIVEYNVVTKIPSKTQDFVYGLYWQKQPGLENIKYEIDVQYPKAWNLRKITPQGNLSDHFIQFKGDLKADYVMAVSFSL